MNRSTIGNDELDVPVSVPYGFMLVIQYKDHFAVAGPGAEISREMWNPDWLVPYESDRVELLKTQKVPEGTFLAIGRMVIGAGSQVTMEECLKGVLHNESDLAGYFG